MGPGLSPARARPGARVFSRARGPTFGEGLKPGPARARGQKPGGFEGLSKYYFLGNILGLLIKKVDIKNANYLGILFYIYIGYWLGILLFLSLLQIF